MANYKELPQLSIGEALNIASKKLFNWHGRSRRSEFWWSYLCIAIASVLLSWIPLLGILISLFLAVVGLFLTIRRLHDVGKSGWYAGIMYIIGLVVGLIYALVVVVAISSGGGESGMLMAIVLPFILSLLMLAYGIYLLILLVKDSEKGENQYGPSPKYVPVGQNAPVEPEPELVAPEITDAAKEVQEDVKEVVEDIKEAADDVADKVKDAADTIVEKAKDVADDVKEAVKKD